MLPATCSPSWLNPVTVNSSSNYVLGCIRSLCNWHAVMSNGWLATIPLVVDAIYKESSRLPLHFMTKLWT